jgi:arylsulfatase/uncharacterized sulfatase
MAASGGWRVRFHGLIAASVALTALLGAQARAEDARPPNFVVILFDDVAFMDLGPFGGEARTPTLDALARRGTIFTRYHTSPLCSPSRAMLLTGLTNHGAGVATIPEVLPPEHEGKPGYRLHLEPGAVTIAARLKEAGWRTYMSGKWHLGDKPGQLPNAHGFQRSFALDASGADNWDHKSYMPYYAGAPWYEDDRPTRYPSGRFSSDVIVDWMIARLRETEGASSPFFAYVSLQAVHIPVQAPREYTARHRGRFDAGWDVLAAERFARGKALGLIPQDAPAPPRHPALRAWTDLTPAERAMQARAMEVQTGMIEATDAALGRLVAHLDATGALENTIFIVTSDNGPEPSAPDTQRGFKQWAALNGYRRDIETLGERGSHNWIGPEWANALATPGRLFKFHATGGGLRVPFIVAGPGVQDGKRSDAGAFVTDVTPTLLAFAGLPPDAPGAKPIAGRSLKPVLEGVAAEVRGPEEGHGVEVSGSSAWFQGDHKLVRVLPPWGDGRWRLHDIRADPGETRDLSAVLPARFAELKAGYEAYARANGVLELPPGYQVQRQVARNALRRQIELHGWKVALALVVAVGLIVWAVRAGPKRRARGAGARS